MTANAPRDLLYFATGAILLVRTYQLVRMDWARPLGHGPGFFLAFEVPPDFYVGAGVRWLRRFRSVLLAEWATEWIAAAAMIAAGWWWWLPFWAGGSAILYVGSLSLFGLVASRNLGRAGGQPAVALSFEERRLRDYLSPSAEGLVIALLGASWLLLAVRGDDRVRWIFPVVATYFVMALLGAKVVAIRAGAPLPIERTEEHHQYFEACRRYGLRAIDAARWLFVLLFGGYAVLHSQWEISVAAWLQWSLVAAALTTWLTLVATIILDARRLDAMGRGLRPAMSWAGPFRPSPWASRGGGIWAVSFLAGLIVLFVIFGL